MKTVQFFISLQGIAEVTVDDKAKFYCNCDGFKARKRCKHTAWCEMEVKRGTFPIQVEKYTPQAEIEKAKESPEAFRELLIKYGKIEVI